MFAAQRLTLITLSALALATSASLAQAPTKNDKPDPPRVIASAAVQSFVQPDSARISFSVHSHEPIDKSAREANEKQVKKIREAIVALPLNKSETSIHVVPTTICAIVTGAHNTGGPNVQSRKAQSVFQVTVRDKDFDKLREAVGRILECAGENGAVAPIDTESHSSYRVPRFNVGGNNEEEPEALTGPVVEWAASGADNVRRDAIRAATKAALADAEAAVNGGKLQVAEIYVTSSESSTERISRYSTEVAPMLIGMVRVSVDVRVTCTY